MIDGEAICCGPDGIADFELLHSRRHDRETILVAFDLVELDGRDLRDEPIEARKAQLAKLLSASRRHEPVHTALQLCEHLEGDGLEAFAAPARLASRASFRNAAARPIARAIQRRGSRSGTRRARHSRATRKAHGDRMSLRRFGRKKPAKDKVLYVVDGNPMTAEGLRALGTYLDEMAGLSEVADGMRALIEKEFPQHVHKLPPKLWQ
jgi:hypothetical protein